MTKMTSWRIFTKYGRTRCASQNCIHNQICTWQNIHALICIVVRGRAGLLHCVEVQVGVGSEDGNNLQLRLLGSFGTRHYFHFTRYYTLHYNLLLFGDRTLNATVVAKRIINTHISQRPSVSIHATLGAASLTNAASFA